MGGLAYMIEVKPRLFLIINKTVLKHSIKFYARSKLKLPCSKQNKKVYLVNCMLMFLQLGAWLVY